MKYRISLLLLLSILPACGTDSSAFRTLTIQSHGEVYTFRVEIAETDQQRQQGLMGRESLGDHEGMLFVFPALSLNSFWMKNTPLSLDIIFIGPEGNIQEIAAAATPNSEELITPTTPYRYVLEIKGGVSASLGLAVGDQVVIPD